MPMPFMDVNVDEWARLYEEEGLSLREIAQRYEVSHVTVWRRLVEAGVALRDTSEAMRTVHGHRPA